MKPIQFTLLATLMTGVCVQNARAVDPLEFTFGGVFKQTTGSVHQVGAPFTSAVLFEPNQHDAIDSPFHARYQTLEWSLPGTTVAPIVVGSGPAAQIEIYRYFQGVDTWSVFFRRGAYSNYTIAVDFPPGTFQTDALPSTLDLSQSVSARFAAFVGDAGLELNGTITSLTVRTIPEQTFACGLIVGAHIGRRPRRR